MKQLNEYEKGFLEGLIDGEGSIHITNYNHFYKDRQKSYKRVAVRLSIANNSRELLHKALTIIGSGHILQRGGETIVMNIELMLAL